MKQRNLQKGFTIIELVVVILLLGILTATALPRFMDVSDEAHGAVVNGLQGGMQTGLALYRAQWMAEGQSTTKAVGYGAGTLFANSSGYPIGTDATFADGATDCVDTYNALLQQGGLPVAGETAFNADDETAAETGATASTTADVIAMPNSATPTGCEYFYVGQYRSGTSTNSNTIRKLSYNATTGVVTPDTVDLLTD